MAEMAERQLRLAIRSLARLQEAAYRSDFYQLHGCGRGGHLLRLDRQSGQEAGRRTLCAEVYAAKGGQQVVDDQSPPLCRAGSARITCRTWVGACADKSKRRCVAPVRVDDPTLYRKTIQGQSTCLAIFRRAGSLVSACVYRLDRSSQTRGNERETSSRSAQPAGGGQETGPEIANFLGKGSRPLISPSRFAGGGGLLVPRLLPAIDKDRAPRGPDVSRVAPIDPPLPAALSD